MSIQEIPGSLAYKITQDKEKTVRIEKTDQEYTLDKVKSHKNNIISFMSTQKPHLMNIGGKIVTQTMYPTYDALISFMNSLNINVKDMIEVKGLLEQICPNEFKTYVSNWELIEKPIESLNSKHRKSLNVNKSSLLGVIPLEAMIRKIFTDIEENTVKGDLSYDELDFTE